MELNFMAFIIILLAVLAWKIYKTSDIFQLKCIISSVDGNKYCVRDRKKLKESADHLAKVSVNLTKIVDHCKEKFPDEKVTKKLSKGFNSNKIVETLPTSELTAYSENKGEKLAFCIETENGNNKLIDLNTLTFVAIHELSHIGSEQVGHSDEFWKNFKFLLQRAVEIKVYDPVDYKKEPQRYCSMDIHDNPLYDL
tara:strand:+ start:6048 stop:6635 length:588 start_codon:yes stop_codon:yes gene_type:complete